MAKFKSTNKALRTFKPKPRLVPQGLFEMHIDKLAGDGRGVSRVKGKTVFVQEGLPGERVMARYTAIHKQYDEAIVHAVIEASGDRVEPRCEYAQYCGGCNLQHMAYDAQIEHKQQQLKQLFAPMVTDNKVFQPPITAAMFAYRHRARLAVIADKKGCKLGFRQDKSHRVVDINHCEVIYRSLSDQLPAFKQLLLSLKARSSVVELSIAEDNDGKQGLLLSCKQPLPDCDIDQLAAYAQKMQISIELHYTQRGVNDGELQVAHQPLHYPLGSASIKLPFSMQDFTQVNPAINQQLIDTASQWLALKENDKLADYFCGIGNFSLPLAAQVANVTGYELVPAMVEKARFNVAANGIGNAQFKAKNLMTASFAGSELANKVILDPPRAGADKLCEYLASSNVERILYVSCNPETLFRDAQHLVAGNFILQKLALADMFPHTRHSEVVALFSHCG